MDAVKHTFKDGKKTNKNYTFKQAMKDAKKHYKKSENEETCVHGKKHCKICHPGKRTRSNRRKKK